jgi:hypothetical protein
LFSTAEQGRQPVLGDRATILRAEDTDGLGRALHQILQMVG